MLKKVDVIDLKGRTNDQLSVRDRIIFVAEFLFSENKKVENSIKHFLTTAQYFEEQFPFER